MKAVAITEEVYYKLNVMFSLKSQRKNHLESDHSAKTELIWQSYPDSKPHLKRTLSFGAELLEIIVVSFYRTLTMSGKLGCYLIPIAILWLRHIRIPFNR